jgi:hypothetical protein
VIVIADKVGQLGNRLFHFAHFVAFGRSHDVAVANPGFGDFASFFPELSSDPLCRVPARRSHVPATERTREAAFRACALLARGPVPKMRLATGEACDLRSPEFRRQAERRRLLMVSGWLFRDDASFREQAGLLRLLFKPADVHLRSAERTTGEARRDCDVLVGVHVRHGDYAQYAGGRHFHPVDAYARLIERLAGLFPGRRPRFLVCSDDPASCTALRSEHVMAGPGQLVEDMYALAGCDYIVGPPSTFSAWASFYGEVPLHHFQDPDAELSLEAFRVSTG